MKKQKRTNPRDTCDTRDTRQAGAPPITFLQPFKILPLDTPSAPVWDTSFESCKTISGIQNGFNALFRMAQEDSPDGLLTRKILCDLTSTIVGQLNDLTRFKPDLWRPIAVDCIAWPVLSSPHPMIKAQAEATLKALNVGSSKTGLRADHSARWNAVNDFVSCVALQLLCQFASARVTLMRQPDLESGLQGWRRDFLELPTTFSPETWREWWEVARQYFLEAYPHPEQIKELAQIARQQLDPDLHTPGRIKGRILYILESRFRSLAGR